MAVLTGGFFTLKRKSCVWQLPWRQRLVVIELIRHANWKDTEVWLQGRLVSVPRGTAFISLRRFSKKIGVGIQTLRSTLGNTAINTLLTHRSTHRGTHVTILDYESYQGLPSDVGLDQHTDQPRTVKKSTHQPTTSKQGIKETKKERVSKSSTGKTKKRSTLETLTADERRIASIVLDRLSEAVGAQFSVCESNVKPLVARIRDGASENDLRMVVWSKANEWESDDKMRRFLTPSTLFAAANFAKYLPHARVEWGSGPSPTALDAAAPSEKPSADGYGQLFDLLAHRDQNE